MYQSFFDLRERPFELTPNPRFLVMTEGHREALSNLEYGIASRRGITALLGEAGTGKTTLIRTALERQPERVHAVYLHNPALTREEFVETLATRFELTEAATRSKAAFLAELEQRLRERFERGETSVLIVDEAQSLPLELLEEIRLLGNIETSDTKLLSIVLAGQPELGERLNSESLRQLKQRIALRCQLRPLTTAETAAYLAGRIKTAGGVGSQVLTREAVIRIHERASGIPRSISVIADNALVSGYALRIKPVNSRIVDEVCRDLDLAATGATIHAAATLDASVAAAPPDAPAGPVLVVADRDDDDAAAGTAIGGAEAVPVGHAAGDSSGLFTRMFPRRRPFSFFKGH